MRGGVVERLSNPVVSPIKYPPSIILVGRASAALLVVPEGILTLWQYQTASVQIGNSLVVMCIHRSLL